MPAKVLGLAGFKTPVSAIADVEAVERAIESTFQEPRFKAYLQRHEFEALVLADFDALERVFHRDKLGLQRLRIDIAGFVSGEEINHGSATHPSARLSRAVVGYEDLKASNAYFVLAEAGLAAVRARCPRFDGWLGHWENWGGQT